MTSRTEKLKKTHKNELIIKTKVTNSNARYRQPRHQPAEQPTVRDRSRHRAAAASQQWRVLVLVVVLCRKALCMCNVCL